MKLLKPRMARSLAVVFTCLLTSGMTTTVLAQQDPNNPMPLDMTNQAQNAWSSNRQTDFYYTFIAGPGEVHITLNAKTSSPGGETVAVNLLRTDFSPVGSKSRMFVIATRRGNQEMKQFNFSTRQRVILKVSVENASRQTNSGEFTLRLDGAVESPLSNQPSTQPESACAASIQVVYQELRQGRTDNLIPTVDKRELSATYPDHPAGRPYAYLFGIPTSYASEVLDSPQLMNSLATRIIRDCNSVSSVSFAPVESDYTFDFGLMSDGSIQPFQCIQPTSQVRPRWGFTSCP